MINIHGISRDIEYDIVHRFRKHEVTRLQWTNSTVETGVGEPDRYFVLGQRRNLKSRLFKEINQPIDYTPNYTFKC
jgi:hypothetical protein